MLKILYIAGHARSGSTALEAWLNSNGVGCGLGEVRDVFRFGEKGYQCACGVPVNECPWWKPILDETLKRSGLSLKLAADLTDSIEKRASLLHPARDQEYRYNELWTAFWNALYDTGLKTVIDSSKSHRQVRRRLRLMKKMPVQTCPILLERSRIATVDSAKQIGAQFGNGAPFRKIPILHETQASLAWFASNWEGALASNMYAQSALCSLEELNAEILKSLAGYLTGNTRESPTLHFIGGNRHRFSGKGFVFNESKLLRLPSNYLRFLMKEESRSWIDSNES